MASPSCTFCQRVITSAISFTPTLSDAWKGFGAAIAVLILALPTRAQARVAKVLWQHRAIGALIAVLLAVVHVVPAADHLPKLFAAPSYGDAWRGILAAVAVAWFSLPRALQIGVVRKLMQRPARGQAVTVRAII